LFTLDGREIEGRLKGILGKWKETDVARLEVGQKKLGNYLTIPQKYSDISVNFIQGILPQTSNNF
jgi:hypothetical protein